jgi:hypothetical protein
LFDRSSVCCSSFVSPLFLFVKLFSPTEEEAVPSVEDTLVFIRQYFLPLRPPFSPALQSLEPLKIVRQHLLVFSLHVYAEIHASMAFFLFEFLNEFPILLFIIIQLTLQLFSLKFCDIALHLHIKALHH